MSWNETSARKAPNRPAKLLTSVAVMSLKKMTGSVSVKLTSAISQMSDAAKIATTVISLKRRDRAVSATLHDLTPALRRAAREDVVPHAAGTFPVIPPGCAL